jgi:hypothetical protein
MSKNPDRTPMSLEEFLYANDLRQTVGVALPSPNMTQVRAELTGAADGALVSAPESGISHKRREKFAAELSSLATSRAFIAELSDSVGQPAPGESEDAFVARAKSVMREQLRRKLRG